MGNRQIADLFPGIYVNPQILKQFLGILIHFLIVRPVNACHFSVGNPSHPDIFHDVACHDRVQFLMDHRNACHHGGLWSRQGYTLSFDPYFSFIRLVKSKGTFHQCGFAGAVLPHQCVDGPWPHDQGNVIQRFDTRKTFGDMLHFKDAVICLHKLPSLLVSHQCTAVHWSVKAPHQAA